MHAPLHAACPRWAARQRARVRAFVLRTASAVTTGAPGAMSVATLAVATFGYSILVIVSYGTSVMAPMGKAVATFGTVGAAFGPARV